MSCDLFITRAEVAEIIRNEKQRATVGNGFYNWDLDTPTIRRARAEAKSATLAFLHGKLSRKLFLAALHIYFEAVYIATEEQFVELCESFRPKILDKDKPLPIDCVKLAMRDLEFISDRYTQWFGERYEFTNDIGEQDYSHVVLNEITEHTVLNFGKCRGLTVGQVMYSKPDYLVWMKTNTQKLDNIVPELWQKILAIYNRSQEEL